MNRPAALATTARSPPRATASWRPLPLTCVYAVNTVTATITISLPSEPEWLGAAVNPVTHMVYLADAHGSVVVINANTDSVAATIPLADPVMAPNPRPVGVSVDTATNTIHVADAADARVAVIDGATNAVTRRIALPAVSNLAGVGVDPAVGLVYVADCGTGAISVIDTATASVSTLVSGITQPYGLALDKGTGPSMRQPWAAPWTTWGLRTSSTPPVA